MKKREEIESLPSRLIILYDNGYKEIAKYDYENDKFNQFEIFNEDDKAFYIEKEKKRRYRRTSRQNRTEILC